METSETESARASGGSVDSEGSFDVNSSIDISGRLLTSSTNKAATSPSSSDVKIRVQMITTDGNSFETEDGEKIFEGLPGVKVRALVQLIEHA